LPESSPISTAPRWLVPAPCAKLGNAGYCRISLAGTVDTERANYIPHQPRLASPPAWGIEAPRVNERLDSSRSWRQAYRLLATLERGRPDGGTPVPTIKLDPIQNSQGHTPTTPPRHWLSIEYAGLLLENAFSPQPLLQIKWFEEMSGSRRQVTLLASTAAVRDTRGFVLLAWHDQQRLLHHAGHPFFT
jgi:hypothetical protein